MKCAKRFPDLTPEEQSQVVERCRSSKFSSIPMLGLSQDLVQVIRQDQETLARLGITPKQIKNRIKSLMIRAARAEGPSFSPMFASIMATMGGEAQVPEFEGNVDILVRNPEIPQEHWAPQLIREARVQDRGHFLIDVVSWGGSQTCPFHFGKEYHGYKYGADDVLIFNQDIQESIRFGSLLPHMIKRHGFFEGQGAYRLDPERLVRVLAIEPGVSYKLAHVMQQVWKLSSSGSTNLVALPEGPVYWENQDSQHHLMIMESDRNLLIIKTETNKGSFDMIIDGAELKCDVHGEVTTLVRQEVKRYQLD